MFIYGCPIHPEIAVATFVALKVKAVASKFNKSGLCVRSFFWQEECGFSRSMVNGCRITLLTWNAEEHHAQNTTILCWNGR
jgi:hypothetical protein